MEMRYLWLLCQTTQRYIKVYYHHGAENMSDYPGKAHTGHIHKHGRPYYVQMFNSLRDLPTFPRIPEYLDPSRDSQLMKPTVEIAGVDPNTISNYPN
jgi:hypothetical protein